MTNSAIEPVPYLAILVAEDNLLNQKVILRLVRSLGCDVEVAATGREVVAACTRRRFDAVLMDIRMPEMDGLEAARWLRQELPAEQQPHIYAMTAGVTLEDRQACLDAGMDGFITKPVVREQLAELFRTLAANQGNRSADL